MDGSNGIRKMVLGGKGKANLQTHRLRSILGLKKAEVLSKNLHSSFEGIEWMSPLILANQSREGGGRLTFRLTYLGQSWAYRWP